MAASMSVIQWSAQVLADLGVPQTTNNEDNLATWVMGGEGGNPYGPSTSGVNNPLNIGPGAQYASLTDAATATAATLSGQGNGYPAIVSALKNNAPWSTFSAAVRNSSWDGNVHYQGNDAMNAPTPMYSGGVAAKATATGTNAGTSTVACLISMPSVAGVGGGCLLTKSNGKALVSGLMVGAGGLIMFFGLAMLTAFGLGHTQAGKAAKSAMGVVPGGKSIAAKAPGTASDPEIDAAQADAAIPLNERSDAERESHRQALEARRRARAQRREDGHVPSAAPMSAKEPAYAGKPRVRLNDGTFF